MKGTPDAPQCGFSRAVCQILDVNVSVASLVPSAQIARTTYDPCTSGHALCSHTRLKQNHDGRSPQGVEKTQIKAFNCLADEELRSGIKEYR